MFLWMKRITHFLDFLYLPSLKMTFRKFETGIFRSSDWGYCQFVFRYHWKGRICNRPIGIVFSRDASTPIRDISNLGVVCDAISMS